MRNTLSITALAALVAFPLAFGATDASASCQGRKNTGTVLGGVTGALLGNAVASGGGKTGGAIIGGLGGAVIGHQIAQSGCAPARTAYRTTRTTNRYASTNRYAPSERYASEQAPVRKIYYDQYGNPIIPASAPAYYAR
jgi:uncharacterized protein YcfJ